MAAQRLTRKHFEALAESIRNIAGNAKPEQLADPKVSQALIEARDCAASVVADLCEPLNDNFDRKRFIEACVGKSTSKK